MSQTGLALSAEYLVSESDYAQLSGRVVGPADIAALAIHLLTNTAVTGAIFDIDGGQQLVEG
ncbi:MAG TPA: hypothetical protein VGR71_05220 [Nitrospira sp.]|nr:hypothetical protein [Nitrospira sp.]